MKEMKIPTENGKYYKKIWLRIYDGGSGQWLWVCRQALSYIFLEVLEMPEYCGRDASHYWAATVSIVDLFTATPTDLAEALRSMGEVNLDDYEFKSERGRVNIACTLWEYGSKAPLWEQDARPIDWERDAFPDYGEKDPEFQKLRARAREFAEENLFDESSRNGILDTKIVNKIGQTARSYMQGTRGLWDHLRLVKELGDGASPEQKLVLTMYQNAGQTLGAGPVPEDLQS